MNSEKKSMKIEKAKNDCLISEIFVVFFTVTIGLALLIIDGMCPQNYF